MIRNIFLEMKICFRKPLLISLLILNVIMFGDYILMNQQIDQNKKIAQEYEQHSTILNFSYELEKTFNGGKTNLEYEKAIASNANVYMCRYQNAENRKCYEEIIEYYSSMKNLVQNYDLKNSVYTSEEYDRMINEYQYLIENKKEHRSMDTMDITQSLLKYQKEGFSFLLMFICMLIGSFSISTDYESDRLKLMIVQPITRTKYLFSRITGNFVCSLFIGLLPIVLMSMALVFYNGAHFDYPYVTFQQGIYQITSEGIVYGKILLFDIVLCLFSSTLGFFFSYFIKEGVLAIISSTSLCVLSCLFINKTNLFNAILPYSYSVYFDIISILNGEYLIQSGNNDINLLFGFFVLFIVSVFLVAIMLLDFRKKDIV